MRSGSERMHTWRRTPFTGRNFSNIDNLDYCLLKGKFNGSISFNNFFLGFLQFLLGFSKVPVFYVTLYITAIHVVRIFNTFLQKASIGQYFNPQELTSSYYRLLRCVIPFVYVEHKVTN